MKEYFLIKLVLVLRISIMLRLTLKRIKNETENNNEGHSSICDKNSA